MGQIILASIYSRKPVAPTPSSCTHLPAPRRRPHPNAPALILLPALAVLALLGLNLLIRKGLAAPRVMETAEPDGLPWEAVAIPGTGQLFGWFIPAGPGPRPWRCSTAGAAMPR
jgi:hypothetical protein